MIKLNFSANFEPNILWHWFLCILPKAVLGSSSTWTKNTGTWCAAKWFEHHFLISLIATLVLATKATAVISPKCEDGIGNAADSTTSLKVPTTDSISSG